MMSAKTKLSIVAPVFIAFNLFVIWMGIRRGDGWIIGCGAAYILLAVALIAWLRLESKKA